MNIKKQTHYDCFLSGFPSMPPNVGAIEPYSVSYNYIYSISKSTSPSSDQDGRKKIINNFNT